MTVKETIAGKINDIENNKFPVGMRVLAVDDDKICLKLLEKLLQKCQYQVTATNEAKVALEMLRENRNRFDIIITDVQMPDMDGFKLLELVGLELDVPVIMLSVDSNPKLVMKGITHGACDYLVKPVRIEELKNIWQHVIRKKKKDPKQPNKPSSQDKDQQGNGKSRNGHCSDDSFDLDMSSKRFKKKRKDDDKQQQQQQDVDDDYDNGTDSDEPGTRKKPRIVWDTDLHNKFVTAVNQLGIGKGAVPKRILEHMNVEGLTRENVASHLQKYRLYLKRIHMMATEADVTNPYMRVNSVDRRFSNTGMSSYKPGILFSSSSFIQANNTTQNISNSFSTISKFDSSKNTLYPGNINLIASSINNLHDAQKHSRYNAQDGAVFSNQSSEQVNAGIGPNFINNGAISSFSSTHGLFSGALNRGTLVPNGIIENNFSLGSHILNNPLDSRREDLFGHAESANNVVPVSQCGQFSQKFDQINGFPQKKMDIPLMNIQNNDLSTSLQQSEMGIEPKTKSDGDYFFEQWRSHGTGYDALDGLLMNSMTKDEDGNLVMDVEFGIDEYSF